MKSLIIFSITIIFLQACTGKASENKSASVKDVIPVKVLPIHIASSDLKIEASGLLTTQDEARLSFKIGGIIESINVEEGQRIRKGQLLATLKSTEISAQVQQVKLSVDKAQRDYQRVQNLYTDSVATLEQMQNAKTGLDIARQNLQQVSFNQAYSKILSPSDGFIVKKTGNVGELANPGHQVLIMAAESRTSKWVLKVGLADKDWAIVETGNKARVQFDAFPGKSFPAVVSRKSLSADPMSGSFEIEIAVEFNGQQPATGMFGRASILTQQSGKLATIPYEALFEANGKTGFVFVTNDQKTVTKIPVRLGEIKENSVQIIDGLQDQLFLVTSGSPYLTDGSAISVSK